MDYRDNQYRRESPPPRRKEPWWRPWLRWHPLHLLLAGVFGTALGFFLTMRYVPLSYFKGDADAGHRRNMHGSAPSYGAFDLGLGGRSSMPDERDAVVSRHPRFPDGVGNARGSANLPADPQGRAYRRWRDCTPDRQHYGQWHSGPPPEEPKGNTPRSRPAAPEDWAWRRQ
jgi:hypothetical protein